jgi:hypothetical protein
MRAAVILILLLAGSGAGADEARSALADTRLQALDDLDAFEKSLARLRAAS